MKEIINLIELSKYDRNLTGVLLEGFVNEFIESNGKLEFRHKFKLIKCNTFKVTYDKYHLLYIKSRHRRKLRRGQDSRKPKIKHLLGKLKENIVSKWELCKMGTSEEFKIISIKELPIKGLSELKLKNFRLRYSKEEDNTFCKIQVKYKLSNMSNELFKYAFNKANRFPNKNSYVDLISFSTQHSRPDEMLLYLHQIFKQ